MLFRSVARLEGLKALQEARRRFIDLKGRAPESLNALVAEGLLAKIPDDPLGGGYVISEGRIVLQPPKN